MDERIWEISCPGCAEGKVRVAQGPSRAEIDAMLPGSMRAPAVGREADTPRFDQHRDCDSCGFSAATLALAIEADGLPSDAKEIREARD